MHSFAKWGLSFSIIFYGILHFLTYFYKNPILIDLLAVFGGGIMFFAAWNRSMKKLKLPLVLMSIGIVILFYSDTSIMEGIKYGFLQMRNLVGLLILVPLISWVLQEEPYMEAVISYGNRLLDTSRKFYLGTISFVQIIAYFLLFGSIQMIYLFINEILQNKKGEAWENFKGTPLLRGFALSTMWVVSIPSFVLVVEMMGASLYISILQGLSIAIVGVLIALIFSYFEEKKYGVDYTTELRREFDEVLDAMPRSHHVRRDFIEFCMLFVTLFGTIFVLQAVLEIELLMLIPMVVAVWIVFYYLYKKRPQKLGKKLKTHFKQDIVRESYQLCVMLGAGMLIFALNQTDFAVMFVEGIYRLQSVLPFLNLLYFLPFIVIILGFFGLGPLTVMAIVGGILASMDLPYPPEIIVLAVTSGSAISILLSPLVMPLITLSAANGLSGFKNGFGFNWKYAVVLYVVIQLYIQTVVFLN